VSEKPHSLADFLERIRAEKLAVLERKLSSAPLEAVRMLAEERAATDPPRGFRDALASGGVSLIAEVKLKSPSAGWIRWGADPAELARAYEAAGAAALSVLTDGPHFGGSLESIEVARTVTDLPVLRKDFIVDEYHVYEARSAGADAVLLIVAMLTGDELRSLKACADSLGMDSLVEVHSGRELDRALAVSPRIVGVNNRNLRDMTVDLANFESMAPAIPEGVVKVCESGVRTRADVERVAAAGADAILVGEILVRADDPGAKARELLGL